MNPPTSTGIRSRNRRNARILKHAVSTYRIIRGESSGGALFDSPRKKLRLLTESGFLQRSSPRKGGKHPRYRVTPLAYWNTFLMRGIRVQWEAMSVKQQSIWAHRIIRGIAEELRMNGERVKFASGDPQMTNTIAGRIMQEYRNLQFCSIQLQNLGEKAIPRVHGLMKKKSHLGKKISIAELHDRLFAAATVCEGILKGISSGRFRFDMI